MGANPFIELVERRKEQAEVHVLFVGPALAGAKKVFKRKNDPVKSQHTHSASEALDKMTERAKTKQFECVMVDMRDCDESSPLNVVAMAALEATGRLVVLANPKDVETFETIVGVDTVLPAPVDPKAIIRTIMECQPKLEEEEEADTTEEEAVEEPTAEQHPAVQVPETEAPVAPQTPAKEEAEAVAEPKDGEPEQKSSVTKGFESSLSIAAEADQQVWQRFVPVANFVYKKLAIIVLSALFLAFLTYGAMIVFFMTSSSWSLPFELSRGHVLVEKVERDLSSMRLRRNELQQQEAIAVMDLDSAKRDLRDGKLRLELTRRTIDEEILAQRAQQLEIRKHIRRLKQVIADFNQLNDKGGFAANLSKAFAKRLITRNSMNSGTLAVLESMHRVVTLQNEVSIKQLEQERVSRRLEFLQSLRAELERPELQIITSAGAELSHLAREVIEAKNSISSAKSVVEASHARAERLSDSLSVITANINSLEKTPIARALIAPVAVMFVPYTNSDSMQQGTRLYGCKMSIIWCREVGEVGARVQGETTAVHPLFGKPLRGYFVEAKFTDPSFVTGELIHANRPPMLF